MATANYNKPKNLEHIFIIILDSLVNMSDVRTRVFTIPKKYLNALRGTLTDQFNQ